MFLLSTKLEKSLRKWICFDRLIMRCIQIFKKMNLTLSSNTFILGLKRIITPRLWLEPWLSTMFPPHSASQIELYSLWARVCFLMETSGFWILLIQPPKQLPSLISLVQRSVIQRHDLIVEELSCGKFLLPFPLLLIVTRPKWEDRRAKQLVATWFQPASCTKGKPR